MKRSKLKVSFKSRNIELPITHSRSLQNREDFVEVHEQLSVDPSISEPIAGYSPLSN